MWGVICVRIVRTVRTSRGIVWRGRRGRCGRKISSTFWQRGDVNGAAPLMVRLPVEGDLDAGLAEEGGCATQAARKSAGRVRPAFALSLCFADQLCQGAQKIRGNPRPLRPRRHERAD